MALSPVSFPDRALASSRGNQQKTPRVLLLELKQSRKQESTLIVVCRWPHRDRNGKPIVRVGTLIRHHMVVRFLGLYCFFLYPLCFVASVFNDSTTQCVDYASSLGHVGHQDIK